MSLRRGDSPGSWRAPFDGGDWLADPVRTGPVGRLRARRGERRRRQRRETRGDKRRRPLEDRLGSGRVSKRGMQEVEEPSGRTTGTQLRPLPAQVQLYPFASSRACKDPPCTDPLHLALLSSLHPVLAWTPSKVTNRSGVSIRRTTPSPFSAQRFQRAPSRS